ncbi:MAG: gluzincin family metallopeptidase [Thermoleophilia bacterium]
MKYLSLAACLLLALTCAGCLAEAPANIDWATPAGTGGTANGDGIQQALDTYAQALVDKDRSKFAGILDQGNPDFAQQELERFDRLIEVPFDRYYLTLIGQTETAPGTIAAKVTTAYTLRGSFPELPDLERAAYFLVKREDGWKLSGDAGEKVLGRQRDARFEDFGKVEVLEGDRSIVLYQAPQAETARQALSMTEASMPRLEEIIPGANLPKVPLKVYRGTDEIDRTFPGKWQEWTGGASRQLGESAEQGGEIIIDAEVFQSTDGSHPGYNQQMIAHELTHITLFPLTGNRTPPFLVEGLADHVAGIQDVVLLKERLQAGGSFSPTLSDIYQPGGFSALLTTDAATLAYEEADTAVALLEEKYGNEKVLSLLREFRRRENDQLDQTILVDEVFRSVLGISWNDFEEEWRRYVLEN